MKVFKYYLFLVIFIAKVFCTSTAFAREFYYPEEAYWDARSAALGGASLPLDDDVSLDLINNPAALAGHHGLTAEPMNINLEATTGTLGALTTGKYKITSLSGIESAMSSNTNSVMGAGGSFFPNVSWGGFAMGVLYQERYQAVNNGNTVDSAYVSQLIPTVGFGLPLARGIVRLGYSIQYVNTTTALNSQPAPDISSALSDNSSSGHAFSQNASAGLVLPYLYRPSFYLVAHSVLGADYSGSSLFPRSSSIDGEPSNEPMTFDASFSIEPRIFGGIQSRWIFELRDLLKATGINMVDRYSVGMEIDAYRNIFLRLGETGAGELSGGIGFSGTETTINLTYFHDVNVMGIGAKYDNRFMFQYVVHFGEDRR